MSEEGDGKKREICVERTRRIRQRIGLKMLDKLNN
jgi:hypothetical protein